MLIRTMRVIEKYPRQVHAVEEFMRKTDEVEARGETNLMWWQV